MGDDDGTDADVAAAVMVMVMLLVMQPLLPCIHHLIFLVHILFHNSIFYLLHFMFHVIRLSYVNSTTLPFYYSTMLQ